MSVLVTGTTGAIAHHFLELLPRDIGPLVAVGLRLPPERTRRRDLEWIQADLREPSETMALFERIQPTRVVHLAGRWSVHAGEGDPEEALLGHLALVRGVLEAVRVHCQGARVLLQSSAEVYGRGPSGRGAETPRSEDDPLLPISVTGSAMACGEILARQYAVAHGLQIVVARPFNLLGPFLSRQYLAADIAAQIAHVRVNRGEPCVFAGDLEVERDYLDVRDAARAYLLLLEHGRAGEAYNVCSARSVPARQIADELVHVSGGGIEIRMDPRRERPAEIPMLVGRNDKIREHVGWVPAVPLQESIFDLWRDRLERTRAERKGKTKC